MADLDVSLGKGLNLDGLGDLSSLGEETREFSTQSKAATVTAPRTTTAGNQAEETFLDKALKSVSDTRSDEAKVLQQNLRYDGAYGISGFVVEQDKKLEVATKTTYVLDPTGKKIPNPEMKEVISKINSGVIQQKSSGYSNGKLYQQQIEIIGKETKAARIAGTVFKLPQVLIETKLFNVFHAIKTGASLNFDIANSPVATLIAPKGDDILIMTNLFYGTAPEVDTAPEFVFKKGKRENGAGNYILRIVTRTIKGKETSSPAIRHSLRGAALVTPTNYVALNRFEMVDLNSADDTTLKELQSAYGKSISSKTVNGRSFAEVATSEAKSLIVADGDNFTLQPLAKGNNRLTYEAWGQVTPDGKPVIKSLTSVVKKIKKITKKEDIIIRNVAVDAIKEGLTAEGTAFLNKVGLSLQSLTAFANEYSSSKSRRRDDSGAYGPNKVAAAIAALMQDGASELSSLLDFQTHDMNY